MYRLNELDVGVEPKWIVFKSLVLVIRPTAELDGKGVGVWG